MIKYTVKSMNEWLYPDSVVSDDSQKSISLCTARNAGCGFQLLVNGLTVGDKLNVTVCSPSAKIYCEIFRELSVCVNKNTGIIGGDNGEWETAKDYATRKAPFRVFDPIEPLPTDGVCVSSTTEAFYIAFNADLTCLPADYKYTFHFVSGDDKFDVDATVSVGELAVTGETLNITNWFSVLSMAYTHNCTPWSDAHWSMIKEYAKLMRRTHQNIFRLTADMFLAYGNKNDGYTFDFSIAEKLIKLFLDMGFTIIEGPHMYFRDLSRGKFFINTPDGQVDALSEIGYFFAKAFFSAWYDFLTSHGWYNKLIQHIADEPVQNMAVEYCAISSIVRKCLPGVKIIDAVEIFDLRGAVDIWVPQNHYYAKHQDEYEKLRNSGDEIWYYTCCFPGGHYCNRLLDFPLLRTRMCHWGNFKYNIPGYLHWGLNFWSGEQDVFEQTSFNGWPAGDGNIVFPWNNTVIGSMRLEQMKNGIEDYELLKAMDPDRADSFCSKIFRAFNDCDNDVAYFDTLHDKMVMGK